MSTIKFNQWQNPDGTENYKCRAWVNFNGTGTVAIRASGNVSSITDNGTGDYTVNFTAAFADVNYAPSITCSSDAATAMMSYISGLPAVLTTTSARIGIATSGGAAADRQVVSAQFFR